MPEITGRRYNGKGGAAGQKGGAIFLSLIFLLLFLSRKKVVDSVFMNIAFLRIGIYYFRKMERSFADNI